MNNYKLYSIIGIVILAAVAIFGGYQTGYQKGYAKADSDLTTDRSPYLNGTTTPLTAGYITGVVEALNSVANVGLASTTEQAKNLINTLNSNLSK